MALRRSMFAVSGAVLVLVAGAGCASADDEPATVASLATAPGELSFVADYSRYLWHTRRLVIQTTNRGDSPVEVTSIALRTGHFLPLPAEEKSTTIAPGARVDVQVDFGELVSCADAPVGPAAVELGLAAAGRGARTVIAHVDPAPFDDIRDRECAGRAVTDAASITFGDEIGRDGDLLDTTLEIDRRAGLDSIRIESLQGSVIIALRPADGADDEPALAIGPDEHHAALPVELFVARCEPHAISQSTLTWVLSAFVTVGDAAAPHKFTLDLPEVLRSELETMITDCIDALPPED